MPEYDNFLSRLEAMQVCNRGMFKLGNVLVTNLAFVRDTEGKGIPKLSEIGVTSSVYLLSSMQ